ncbi:MAG: branched-chain amino acid ABC transporter permease [Bradyrhizobium sp.]
MIAEQIVNGLVLGSMYALIALGYTLVFGVLDKLNLAHPEIFMFGGFAGLTWLGLGAPLWAAILGAVAVAGALGLVVEISSFRKFTGRDASITAALSSLAFGIVIVDLTQKLWGTEPLALPVPTALRTTGFAFAGMMIAWIKLGILAFTLMLMLGLHLVVTRTRVGRNIRAVADQPTSAALLGVDVKRVNQQAFFIASALAGVAGLLLALRTGYVTSDIGLSLGLKALAIMAIGGVGDLRGAMLGGLLVGVLEALAFQFGLGRLADVAVWVLMIAVVLVRPAGLFGAAPVKEARA